MFVLYHIGIKENSLHYGCRIEKTKRLASKILQMYPPTQILFSAGFEVEKEEDLPSETKIEKSLEIIRQKLKLTNWRPL